MPPIRRNTVLSFIDQAIPRRGSQLIAFVILKPCGVFGSVFNANPLFKLPMTLPLASVTKVPTRLVFVESAPVIGFRARRVLVAQAAEVGATIVVEFALCTQTGK